MAGWLESAAEQLGVDPLTPVEIDRLLDATRDIAHGTERRYAPLTAFLIGIRVAGADADARPDALSSAVDEIRQLLAED